MLGADKLVLEPVGLFAGRLYQIGDAGGGVKLPRVVADLGRLFQGGGYLPFHRLKVNAELGKDVADQSFLLLEQRQQDMFHVPLAVLILTNQLLGGS
ncbi:hypothetical protein ES703_91998 [subsurface metagenome]